MTKRPKKASLGPLPGAFDPIPQLLHRFNVPTNWDVLLFGDGSGSGWEAGAGWATIILDRATTCRHHVVGGMNMGSVNLAEAMAYWHAMNWYDAVYGKPNTPVRGILRVYIVTDSQLTATNGTAAADPGRGLPKAQRALWAGMREFARQGYHLEYRWARRNTSGLNQVVDLLASTARKATLDTTAADGGWAEKLAAALEGVVLCDPATGESIPLTAINPGG